MDMSTSSTQEEGKGYTTLFVHRATSLEDVLLRKAFSMTGKIVCENASVIYKLFVNEQL